MPPERGEFKLSGAKERGGDYHHKILEIIKHKKTQARMIEPDAVLHSELHEHRFLDARKEVAEFEPVRKDICESFGIPFDEDHIYIHDYVSSATQSPKVQRALRAFFVVIDLIKDEAFYGEGRAIHNILFEGICDMAKKKNPDMEFELISSEVERGADKFLVFKGFLSNKSFEEIDPESRKVFETPIFDDKHQKIQTAQDWFLTGHNLD